MSLEPVLIQCPNLPVDYGKPIPADIKKYILNVLNLPKTDSGDRFSYVKKIEIVNDLYYYAIAVDSDDNLMGTASHYDDHRYLRIIDPNSVFIHHSKRQSIFTSEATWKPNNGYPYEIVEESKVLDEQLPYPYVFTNNYGYGGCLAVNEDDVTVNGYAVNAVCRCKYTVINQNGTHIDETVINLSSALGMQTNYRNSNGTALNLTLLGTSSKLGVSIYRPNLVYGSCLTLSYSQTLNVVLNTVYSADSSVTAFSIKDNFFSVINSNLYYLLFPKIIFADTVDRIDKLLSMSPEDFKKEIQHDVGKNPYYPNGTSTNGGGGGTYGKDEDYFDTLGLIPIGSSEANDSTGNMYTRYLVSLREMNVLGEWLWADDLGLQVAKTVVSALYGDPVQTVISCVSYPFNLSSVVSSSSVPFHWGGYDAGFTLSALNQNAFSVNWGTIAISEYWGNFLDYSPHTQMQLYLPWGTGFVHIDPNDVLNANSSSSLTGMGTLGVITNVDLSRGICVHHVIANETVIGTYSGSCGRQIPITGSDYASKQVAMAGAAIGGIMAGGVAAGMGAASGFINSERQLYSGSPAGSDAPATVRHVGYKFNWQSASSEASRVGRQAIRPAIASAAALAVSPPSVSRSGSFQEGAGSLSIQQPYLIISRPKMNMPANYGHMYGYPSNISLYLGSISGYTEVGAIHIEGISATSDELDEIETLLKGGVIL